MSSIMFISKFEVLWTWRFSILWMSFTPQSDEDSFNLQYITPAICNLLTQVEYRFLLYV